MNLIFLLILILSVITSCISIVVIKQMLISAGFLRKNYRGENIPLSMGICFLPVTIISLMPLILVTELRNYVIVYLFICSCMCMVGLIDDVFGNKDASGFNGHIGSLIRGRLTTGGFKALFGGICCLFASISISHNMINIIIDTMLIALFTNLINLFDLRPGRAVKVFWFFCIILGALTMLTIKLIISVPIMICSAFYFNGDIKANYMMGDAGSNVLGCTVGFISVISLGTRTRIVLLIVLVLLNLFSEKVSFTKLIEGNRFLNKLDMIGR